MGCFFLSQLHFPTHLELRIASQHHVFTLTDESITDAQLKIYPKPKHTVPLFSNRFIFQLKLGYVVKMKHRVKDLTKTISRQREMLKLKAINVYHNSQWRFVFLLLLLLLLLLFRRSIFLACSMVRQKSGSISSRSHRVHTTQNDKIKIKWNKIINGFVIRAFIRRQYILYVWQSTHTRSARALWR